MNAGPRGPFNKSAFTAFSAGDRQCLGKKWALHLIHRLTVSLAMIELRLVLAHFAYLFNAQLLPTTDPGYNYTVVIHPGPVYAILTPVASSGDSSVAD